MNKAVVVSSAILAAAGAAALFYHLHPRGDSTGPFLHVRNEFEFTVHAPYRVAAPLFGPDGERAWAGGHWDPHFLYPKPAQDIEGAVFKVSHGHHNSTWVSTAFDLDQGHIQYVYFVPDVMVTRIDLHLTQPEASNTKVQVAYERTALTAEANEHVREFGEADRNNGPQWGADIEHYFAQQHQH